MLVQPDVTHVAQIPSQGGADQEEHPADIAADAGFIQLLQAGEDEGCIVVGRVVEGFPVIIALN